MNYTILVLLKKIYFNPHYEYHFFFSIIAVEPLVDPLVVGELMTIISVFILC